MDPYRKNIEEAKANREFGRFMGGSSPSGRVMGGLVILAVGTLLLAYEFGLDLPRWFFSWKTLLIALGLYIGARHKFRSWGWLIPIGIGLVFLAEDIFWGFDIRPQVAWPVAIIIIGLFMILRPKKKRSEVWTPATVTSEGFEQGEVLDTVSVFGGSKKNILSKNFRGGDVVSFFGGSEMNFMQADINGVAILDVTCVFGGAKLIVPSNWTIKSEMVTIFGGMDDKRQMLTQADPNKTLVLEGTVIFGGMEIKSY